jgi:peptidoglycan pentaglycine glycine transferase (the first glycine)
LEIIQDKDHAEYEQFLQSHPKGHFMQSGLWGKVKDNWKWRAVVVRGEEGQIIGGLSVLIRKIPVLPYSIMYAGRGPVCDTRDRATFQALLKGARQLAKQERSYVLKMDPDIPATDTDFVAMAKESGFKIGDTGTDFDGIQPRFVFRLDLNGLDEESLLKHFESKTRYNVRLAVRKGVQVHLADVSELPEFHRIMIETGVRDNFVVRTEDYFKKMLNSLGEHARLYMATIEGKPVAGTLAIWYGNKVWYLYGASSNYARNYMPNYLLQYEMMKWALERKCDIYDFRGVSGDLSESNPLYGLYRFKKGFNGVFTEFIGEMDLVFNRFIYVAVQKGEPAFRRMRKRLYMLKPARQTRVEIPAEG